MAKNEIQARLDSILDQLAALEHERWAHWQKHVHDICRRNSDGSITIPEDLVRRWDVEISKLYSELTEAERESDREQVRNYLPLIVSTLSDP